MTADITSWVGLQLAGGRYQVTARLGAGGMAVVYRARDDQLGRDVVIKVPRRAMFNDPEFAGRFAREVRSLAQLVHAHIVKVIDVGEHDGLPFLILECLPGGSLRDRQQRGQDGKALPCPPESLLGWLAGVASALDFIHQQHYVHRDVKPDNILFDEHRHVYLSDFGVAKILASAGPKARQTVLTGTGMVLGTPQYMAPELILGESYDGRVDQYGLAVTVYELLTGRLPLDGPTPAAVLVQQTTQPPPPLHVAVPAIPALLSAAVHRALAKDPAKRFPDCTSFADAALGALNKTLVQVAPQPARKGTPVAAAFAEIAETVISCPNCGKSLKVRDSSLGKRVRCPACQLGFEAMEPPILAEAIRGKAHNRRRGPPSEKFRQAKNGGGRMKGLMISALVLLLLAGSLAALVWSGFLHRFVPNRPPSLRDTTPRITLTFHDKLIDKDSQTRVTPDGPPPGTTGLLLPTMRFGVLAKEPSDAQEEKKLTFDRWGRSNNACLRIDGDDQLLVGVPPGEWKKGEMAGELGKATYLVKREPVELKREGYRSVWLLDDGKIQVTQVAEVVPGAQSHLLDTCLVRYQVENLDKRAHKVGLRFLLDTFIGTNDGVPFTVPGDDKLTDTMREFNTEKDVPDFIQALEKPDLAAPGTVARVTFKTKGLESPGRVLLGAWPRTDLHGVDKRAVGHMTLWDVPLLSMKDKALRNPDSGVTMYWDEREFKAGEKREVGFAYGLGTITGMGRIRLTLGGSFEPGGTLTVMALVNDPKPGERVTLSVPAGFKVAGDDRQPVPEATAGRNYSPVTWKVTAGPEEGDYDLKVRSTTGDVASETVTLQSGRNIFD